MHPFLLVSLVNIEKRPPGIVYGIIEKIKGHEKTDKDFVDFFLLWLNEHLKTICSQTEKKDYGWVLNHKLSGKADANKLTARVLFHVTRLFDITTEEDLSERAATIGEWFTDLLSNGNVGRS